MKCCPSNCENKAGSRAALCRLALRVRMGEAMWWAKQGSWQAGTSCLWWLWHRQQREPILHSGHPKVRIISWFLSLCLILENWFVLHKSPSPWSKENKFPFPLLLTASNALHQRVYGGVGRGVLVQSLCNGTNKWKNKCSVPFEHPDLGVGNSQSLHFCFLPLSPVGMEHCWCHGQDRICQGWSSHHPHSQCWGHIAGKGHPQEHQDSQAPWEAGWKKWSAREPCNQNLILPLLPRAGSGNLQKGGHRVSAWAGHLAHAGQRSTSRSSSQTGPWILSCNPGHIKQHFPQDQAAFLESEGAAVLGCSPVPSQSCGVTRDHECKQQPEPLLLTSTTSWCWKLLCEMVEIQFGLRVNKLRRNSLKKKKRKDSSKNAEWICSFQRQIFDTSPRREVLA